MFLWWSLFLGVTGACGAFASCPSAESICPCTCRIITDKNGEDFAIMTCERIQSEDSLLQILYAAKGENLFELKIVDSVLQYIPHEAFHDTTFEVIVLENSSISALTDTDVAFEGLENSLHLLDVTNCSFITNWDWSQLSHLNYLKEVVVMHSDFVDIPSDLSPLHHLEFEAFVLKDINLRSLGSDVFAPFELLARLTLDRNQIETIERTMFPRPASYLKILGLSHNNLKSLPEDIFADMPALSSIYLSGNPLQIIDESIFTPVWSQLKLVFFSDTKLTCDCRLIWLMKWDNSKKYIRAFCESPGEAKGRDLLTLEPQELC